MIVQNCKVILVQVAHELSALIGGDKQDVDLVNPLFDGQNGVSRLISRGWGLRVARRKVVRLRLESGRSHTHAQTQTQKAVCVLRSQSGQNFHLPALLNASLLL